MSARLSWDRLLGGALLLLCLAFVALISIEALRTAINYDEAYNLQVVDSLAHGHGYATYGVARPEGRWAFDPYISTGAVILVPLAALWRFAAGHLWVVQAGLVLVFWAYVALVLSQAGRGGRFVLPAAMALAAALAFDGLPVGRVLGELPGAALLWLAAVAVVRDRPVAAALLAGLAVQVKLVYGLAGVVLLGSFVFHVFFFDSRYRLWTVLGAAAAFIAPSATFELYRWIALGDPGYGDSVAQYIGFLYSQTLDQSGGWLAPKVLAAKIEALYHMWPRSIWVVLLLAGAMFMPVALLVRHEPAERGGKAPVSLRVDLMLICMAWAGLAMLGAWITQSRFHDDARQALPFALLAAPAMVALTGRLLVRATCSQARLQRWFGAGVLAFMALSLAYALVVRGKQVWASEPQARLADRKAVAQLIRDYQPDSLLIADWWQNPEYLLGSGLEATPARRPGKQIFIVQDYQVALLRSTWEAQSRPCAQVLYRSSFTLVCAVAQRRMFPSPS